MKSVKGRIFIGLLAVAVMSVFALGGAVAETTKSGEVKDEFVIYNTVDGYKNKKPGVPFTHKKHSMDYKLACTDCHHHYEGGKNVFKEGDKVKKCIECHDMKKNQGKVKKIMTAFHNNCRDCHKDAAKAGKPTGPTKKCADCHSAK